MTASNREREQYLKEFGWNWVVVKPLKTRIATFKYGASVLIKPRIRVER